MPVLFIRNEAGAFEPIQTIIGEKGPPGDPGVYIGTEEPTDPDVSVWIDTDGEGVELPEAYVLPAATADTLGGVMVGPGLQINAAGVLGVKPEGVWELIETITVEETITRVERTQEPDGTPYRLKAAFVKVTAQPTTETRNGYAFFISGNTNVGGGYIAAMGGSTDKTSTVFTYPIYGRWFSLSCGAAQSETNNAQVYNYPKLNMARSTREYPYIDLVAVTMTGGFSVGSTIEIWGVRADA